MSSPLPERPHAPTGQRPAADQVQALIDAVNDALAQQATSHRDTSPVPTIGTAPPVTQPGRPPMSQKATDASVLMLSGGVTTVLVGGTASLAMLASGYADPVVCAIIFGAPAVLILAVSRLVKAAKDAVPPEHHHHYTGPVHQDQRSTVNHNRWWGSSSTRT